MSCRYILILSLITISAFSQAKGSSYEVQPYSPINRLKPCMWQASANSWIDLMSVVRLEKKRGNTVVIHLGGVRDTVEVSTINPDQYVADVINSQQTCQKMAENLH